MPEELASLYYWGVQAPLRSLFSMLCVFYTYFLGPSSPIYGASASRSSRSFSSPAPSSRHSTWGGDELKNRVFSTFVFLEMISWFWIWVTLREERNDVIERLKRRSRAA